MFTPGSRACGYRTASGRAKWLSRDPIAENGGMAIYGFCLNSPINAIDRLGLIGCFGFWTTDLKLDFGLPRLTPIGVTVGTHDPLIPEPAGSMFNWATERWDVEISVFLSRKADCRCFGCYQSELTLEVPTITTVQNTTSAFHVPLAFAGRPWKTGYRVVRSIARGAEAANAVSEASDILSEIFEYDAFWKVLKEAANGMAAAYAHPVLSTLACTFGPGQHSLTTPQVRLPTVTLPRFNPFQGEPLIHIGK